MMMMMTVVVVVVVVVVELVVVVIVVKIKYNWTLRRNEELFGSSVMMMTVNRLTALFDLFKIINDIAHVHAVLRLQPIALLMLAKLIIKK